MISFYTRMLTTSELGTGEIIINIANLLTPIASVCIAEGIIRFGLDRAYNKSQVFSTGIFIFLIGFIALLLFAPLFNNDSVLKDYKFFVYLYVLASCTKNICAQFIRSRNLVKLFAIDGILSTIYVVAFNVIALGIFDMGVTGYVLSVILADILSIIFLFYMGSLHRYITFNINKKVITGMLIFSLPMIPNAVSWWITNVSDMFFVKHFCGADQTGLYNVAYKIPTIITAVSLVFSKAWQISAFTENDPKQQRRFFTKIFKIYQSFIMISMSGLIMLIKPITSILIGKDFYDSWEYVPFLIIGVGFSCFVTFLGSIYMTKKKTVMSMVTTVTGAIINIVLNLILIPLIGPQGAAIATFCSFLVVFIIRAVDTKRLIPLKYGAAALTFTTVIIIVQSISLITQSQHNTLIQILCCLTVFITYLLSYLRKKI